jgi:hypothetical protein
MEIMAILEARPTFGSAAMSNGMNQYKATANAHMRRDGEHWTCMCEACHAIRSLMGVDKILAVRPLVREIQLIEDRLLDHSEGPEKAALEVQFRKLHDQLAAVMEK